MSMFASMNCCDNSDLDIALNVISCDTIRITCMNCGKTKLVHITRKQFDEIYDGWYR